MLSYGLLNVVNAFFFFPKQHKRNLKGEPGETMICLLAQKLENTPSETEFSYVECHDSRICTFQSIEILKHTRADECKRRKSPSLSRVLTSETKP